jgi:hypothetical protein
LCEASPCDRNKSGNRGILVGDSVPCSMGGGSPLKERAEEGSSACSPPAGLGHPVTSFM